MLETADELAALQALLDRSHAGAGGHLRGIITDDRTLSAAELTALMSGMRTLALATVTARGEPRVSGVDGHLLHGRWVFTTSADALKARHLRVRPAVSAAYLEGDELAVFTHGDVEILAPTHPDFAAIEAYLAAHYGVSPSTLGPRIDYCRIRPHWMVGYCFQRSRVLAERGVTESPRSHPG